MTMVEAVNETGTPMRVCDIDEKEPPTTNEKLLVFPKKSY